MPYQRNNASAIKGNALGGIFGNEFGEFDCTKTKTTNKMIEKVLEIAFTGFWPFIGILILTHIVIFSIVNGLLKMWSRFLRMIMVRKHGWPPSHLDADGDWKINQKLKNEKT